MDRYVPLLILVHAIVCLLCFIFNRLGVLKCKGIAVFNMIFLPIFGFVMALRQSHRYRVLGKKEGEFGISRLEADELARSVHMEEREKNIVPISEAVIVNTGKTSREMMKDVLTDINMSILADDEDENIVPLSEALVVNDSSTKRALIMDALYSNPSEYVTQLSKARTNNDTEVVHYAVTALVELQKDYDVKFQELLKQRKENPDDPEIRKAYQRLLEQYINSGLPEGSNRVRQLDHYSEVLAERLRDEPDNFSVWRRKANADLQRGNADDMMKDVEEMFKRWPDREQTYLLRIRCCALKGDREGIDETLEMMKENQIHLTAEGRELVEFWTGVRI